MASATKKNIDMINGPLLKKLIVFSVPLILSGVDTTLVYFIKAIVFMIVVILSCRDRSGLLPR